MTLYFSFPIASSLPPNSAHSTYAVSFSSTLLSPAPLFPNTSRGLRHILLPWRPSSRASALHPRTPPPAHSLLPNKLQTPYPGAEDFQSPVSNLSSLIFYNTCTLTTLMAQQTAPLSKPVLFPPCLFSGHCFYNHFFSHTPSPVKYSQRPTTYCFSLQL